MNNLLSEEYRKVLEQEHASAPWGTVGWRLAPYVHDLVTQEKILSMLDYGAGRGSLGHWFDKNGPGLLERREYEPGIPSLSLPPLAAELVTCIDVMEHIEPESVKAVLDHIQVLAQRWVYFNISVRPAAKILQDGRNAHLTIQPVDWWRVQLKKRWSEQTFIEDPVTQSFNWVGSFRP